LVDLETIEDQSRALAKICVQVGRLRYGQVKEKKRRRDPEQDQESQAKSSEAQGQTLAGHQGQEKRAAQEFLPKKQSRKVE